MSPSRTWTSHAAGRRRCYLQRTSSPKSATSCLPDITTLACSSTDNTNCSYIISKAVRAQLAANGSPRRGLERGNLMSTDRISADRPSLVLTVASPLAAQAARPKAASSLPAHYASLPGRWSLPDRGRSGNDGTTVRRQIQRGAIILRPRAPLTCLPGGLRLVMADVAARFGSISVESTHRSRAITVERAAPAIRSISPAAPSTFACARVPRRDGVFALASRSRRP